MNKKIVKALFSYAVAKDDIRPLMKGVHFEEDVCVASDTHVLVVYKESNPNLAGRTILEDGTDAAKNGVYPAFKRVIPKGKGNTEMLNWSQVYKALKWFKKQPDFNPNDRLAVGECHVSVRYLLNILEIFNAAGELGTVIATTYDPTRPIKLESGQLTAIAMPVVAEPENVDLPRVDCGSVIMSYANLINTFAIESTRPKEKVEEMAWL